MPKATEVTPKLSPIKDVASKLDGRFVIADCKNSLKKLGFGTDTDGLYEIISPAAQHPLALSVAARGIIRAGLLPDRSEREVTTHVSIGTLNKTIDSKETRIRLINLLRAVELAGGSTADRLVKDPRNSYIGGSGWNYKGQAGIEVDLRPQSEHGGCQWQGQDTSRVEFRSLAYSNIEQFGQTLDAVYFLSRGLLCEEGEAAEIYAGFEKWFDDYREQNGLGNIEPYALNRVRFKRTLRTYIEPFAEHIERGDLTGVKQQTAETVDAIKEAFDIPSIELKGQYARRNESERKMFGLFQRRKVI
ncbi:MAG: hypothetical protein AAB462_03055 [Patescibacteria group bacterium]